MSGILRKVADWWSRAQTDDRDGQSQSQTSQTPPQDPTDPWGSVFSATPRRPLRGRPSRRQGERRRVQSRVHVDSLQQLEQTGDTPSSLALPDYMNDSVVMITPPHTGFSRQQVREKNDLSPEVEERLLEAEQVRQEQAHYIQVLEKRNKELQVQLAERNKQFRVLQEKFRMSNFHDEWHQKMDSTLEQLEKMQDQLGAPTPIVVETNEIEKQISEDEVLRTELEKHLSAIETLQATGADLISKSAGVDRGLSAKDMENKLCALHFMWRDIVSCFEQRHKGHEDAKRQHTLEDAATSLNKRLSFESRRDQDDVGCAGTERGKKRAREEPDMPPLGGDQADIDIQPTPRKRGRPTGPSRKWAPRTRMLRPFGTR
ncbi:putative golgin subfamily A member 6-like protein 3 isoform X2 [Branchiostoma lanceolatum]|uniref:putative golgin subfamily A member 6-like protein 3 isoform X2 n=1 Tax=Branchiostoma lanceolatum TaxID=7740 RepID=UPI0034530368